jgi:hypothetical protein
MDNTELIAGIYLVLSGLYRVQQVIITVSKDPKMGKQATGGKKKHVTLMITQKFKIISGLESGKS